MYRGKKSKLLGISTIFIVLSLLLNCATSSPTVEKQSNPSSKKVKKETAAQATLNTVMIFSEGFDLSEDVLETPLYIPQYKPTYVTHLEQEKPSNRILDILSDSYPTGYSLVNTMSRSPWKIRYSAFFHGKTNIRYQVPRLPTAVHEVHHVFSDDYAEKMINDFSIEEYGYNTKSFCITKDEIVLVNMENFKLMPGRELYEQNIVPPELRTRRFDTYIANTTANAPNRHGVLGLLEEYICYYHGIETAIGLFDYYKTQEQSFDTWKDFLFRVLGHYTAYAEFRYWILTYMIYVEGEYPEVYEKVMTDNDFRYVFTIIDQKYEKLIMEAAQTIDMMISFINTNNGKARIDNETLWFYGKGLSLMNDEIEMLVKEMKKINYVQMADSLHL